MEEKIVIIIIVTILFLMIITDKIARRRAKSKWDNYKPTHGFQYYRDALNKISPSVVSFVIDPDLNNNRHLPAEMMKLIVENYIEKQDGKYVVINDDFDHLSNLDKILLNTIKNERFNADEYIKFNDEVKKEAMTLGFIETKQDVKSWRRLRKFIYLMIAVAAIGLAVYLYRNIDQNQWYELAVAGLIIGIPIYLVGGFFYESFYQAALKGYNFVRTKKGNELMEQAMGLKSFLRDYTLLDERTRQEVKMWDYYMVYAIVLKVNGNIHGEVNKEIINMLLDRAKNGVDSENEDTKMMFEALGKITDIFGKNKKR